MDLKKDDYDMIQRFFAHIRRAANETSRQDLANNLMFGAGVISGLLLRDGPQDQALMRALSSGINGEMPTGDAK